MSYTVNSDLWDLSQRVSVLEVNSDKHNARLNKLEDTRDEKILPEGVDFSHTIPGKGYETATVKIDPDPSKLESNKDYALDWYINQYQNMCKEYNKVKIELDDKQKVLELTLEQRDRYLDQIINQKSMIDRAEINLRGANKTIKILEKENRELKSANCDLEKSNQILRGTKENFKDRIFELEKEVKYQAAFANSGKIKELEKLIEDYKVGAMGIRKRILELEDENKEQQNLIKLYGASNADMAKKIKDLEEQSASMQDLLKLQNDENEKLHKLNRVYTRMMLKDE